VRYSFSLACLLSLFWLINSGHYTGLLLFLGAVSVILVTWVAHRMDVVDHETLPMDLFLRMPRYLIWLAGQIVLSNIDLARRVWRPGMNIDPVVKRLPLSQRSDMGRVIYANSINLTPGTLTIDLGEDSVLVHALSHEGMEALETGDMDARVTAVER